jgi:hypothetical protein
MLHACVERFDVMCVRGNILGWEGEVNAASVLLGLLPQFLLGANVSFFGRSHQARPWARASCATAQGPQMQGAPKLISILVTSLMLVLAWLENGTSQGSIVKNFGMTG